MQRLPLCFLETRPLSYYSPGMTLWPFKCLMVCTDLALYLHTSESPGSLLAPPPRAFPAERDMPLFWASHRSPVAQPATPSLASCAVPVCPVPVPSQTLWGRHHPGSCLVCSLTHMYTLHSSPTQTHTSCTQSPVGSPVPILRASSPPAPGHTPQLGSSCPASAPLPSLCLLLHVLPFPPPWVLRFPGSFLCQCPNLDRMCHVAASAAMFWEGGLHLVPGLVPGQSNTPGKWHLPWVHKTVGTGARVPGPAGSLTSMLAARRDSLLVASWNCASDARFGPSIQTAGSHRVFQHLGSVSVPLVPPTPLCEGAPSHPWLL